MTVTIIAGANWGDEGKGKMTDAWAEHAAYVVRYQGGSNAGHTIVNGYGKFALRTLPSGVFHPNVTNVIGPGVALDMDVLLNELQMLADRGVPAPKLMVSERACVVLPLHRLLDELEEERLGQLSFGSTRQGIAPFYSDKAAKLGIPIGDMLDMERLRKRVALLLESKNALLETLYRRSRLSLNELVIPLHEQAKRLAPYLGDTTALLQTACRREEAVVLEAQLGALRDPDHGIYPFTTSTSTLAGYAPVGAGIPLQAISRVVAVVKAYSSCVGAGPFVTELHDEDGEELRRRGGDAGEYGVNTGRPRRVGWFDAVATRYGCMLQGATEAALTNLDVLGYWDEIPVCVGYELADGSVTTSFPVTSKLMAARPVLKKFPGWKCDISNVATYDELPEAAKRYVAFVEESIGVRVATISIGPRREQMIRL
ncbi:adenylosuccinate synthase [Paenibacillus sp. J5C_2022]|uniref:adenylosuccinate synthase n=1 Tax=Paenibacillus sp. J5C2022 TaxID=2977129 RepID=UPI0021D20644|nr:adenylosuccinate synthase [Paenibacillus sp. J5C2022]MCU6713035.1 adenylosuccinate synthase [Paenibacillus sp. J5C2022]